MDSTRIENVFKEIDYPVKRYDINIFNILEKLFSLDEKRIYEFTKNISR